MIHFAYHSRHGPITSTRCPCSAHRQTVRALPALRQHARLIRKGTRPKRLEIVQLWQCKLYRRGALAPNLRWEIGKRSVGQRQGEGCVSLHVGHPQPSNSAKRPPLVNEFVLFGGEQNRVPRGTDAASKSDVIQDFIDVLPMLSLKAIWMFEQKSLRAFDAVYSRAVDRHTAGEMHLCLLQKLVSSQPTTSCLGKTVPR